MVFILVLAKPQGKHSGSDTAEQQRCINSQRAAGFEDAASILQDDPRLTFRLTLASDKQTAFMARFAFFIVTDSALGEKNSLVFVLMQQREDLYVFSFKQA